MGAASCETPSGSPPPLRQLFRKHQPMRGNMSTTLRSPHERPTAGFLLDQELSELRRRQLRRGGQPAQGRDRRPQQQGLRRAGPAVHAGRVARFSRGRTKRGIRPPGHMTDAVAGRHRSRRRAFIRDGRPSGGATPRSIRWPAGGSSPTSAVHGLVEGVARGEHLADHIPPVSFATRSMSVSWSPSQNSSGGAELRQREVPTAAICVSGARSRRACRYRNLSPAPPVAGSAEGGCRWGRGRRRRGRRRAGRWAPGGSPSRWHAATRRSCPGRRPG